MGRQLPLEARIEAATAQQVEFSWTAPDAAGLTRRVNTLDLYRVPNLPTGLRKQKQSARGFALSRVSERSIRPLFVCDSTFG
ncbi:MAG: hypothetical protein EBZ48_15820 [Proteobacteria bacterium]|nr:hypothetical protein [Pseudomonadota bacterium]